MTDFLSQLVRRRETEPSSSGIFNKEKSISSDPSDSDELVQQVIRYINKSGLFDADFYLASYPDIATAGVEPFATFSTTDSAREGAQIHISSHCGISRQMPM